MTQSTKILFDLKTTDRKRKFKTKCSSAGVSMTKVITQLIDDYIHEEEPKKPKK